MNRPSGKYQIPVTRRKFLKTSIMGASAMALAACGSATPAPTLAPAKPTDVPKPAPTAAPAGALRIAINGVNARADTFKKIGAAFEAKNPGVKVEWVAIQAAEWDEYFGKLVTLIASGDSIDLAEISTEGLQLISSRNVLRPLNPYVTADKAEMQGFFSDVAPQLVEVAMYKGDLMVLPTLWGAATIYYSKRLFDKAGLTYPKDDWTVEDFNSAAQKIHSLGSDVYGFGFPNRHWGGLVPWMYVNESNLYDLGKETGGDWLWGTFYGGVESAKGRAGGLKWGNPTANSPSNIEALQWQQDLIWKQKVSPSPTDLNQLAVFMANDKLGMMPGHRAHTGVLLGAGLKKGEFDVALMPKWKTQRHQFGTSGLGIMKTSKNPDLAWNFIKHQTSKEQLAIYVDKAVHTASRRSVTNDPAQHETTGPANWQVFYNTLDKNPLTTAIPAPLETKDMTGIFTKYVGLALANESTPKDALDKMQTELEALMKRQRPA